MNQWILVANASYASLYSSKNLRTSDLDLVKEFSHPDSRKKVTDLVSSRSGSFRGRGKVCSNAAYERTNPKDVEAEVFAQELCKELKTVCTEKSEKLYIITTAHFYGLLEKHLNCKAAIEYIAKDYTRYKQPKLLEALREHIFK